MKNPVIQILLFAFISIFSAYFALFSPAVEQSEWIIIFLGYSACLILLSAFILSITASIDFKTIPNRPLKQELFPIAAIIGATCWLLSVEPFMFKIVVDEILLSSTGQMLHSERTPTISTSANFNESYFLLKDAHLDKRSFMLPFLISIIHDISGYRVSNVFIVNSLLTISFLSISFYFIRTVLSSIPAYLTLVLICSSPLIASAATSGNSGMLNIVMILLNIVLAFHFNARPSKKTLAPLILGMLVMAYSRYESSVLILPFSILVLWVWNREKKIILPWAAYAAPLFFIIPVMQHQFTLKFSKVYWQSGPDGRIETFSHTYFGENLKSAYNFLFSLNNLMPNSILVSIMGIAGVFTTLIVIAQKKSIPLKKELLVLIFALVISNLTLILFFNYGLFDKYITSRLSLPLHLFLFIFAAIGLSSDWKRFLQITIITGLLAVAVESLTFSASEWIEQGIFLMTAILALLIFSAVVFRKPHNQELMICIMAFATFATALMPKMRQHEYFQVYSSPHEIEIYSNFIQENGGKNTLFVTTIPYLPILYRQSAINPGFVFKNTDQIKSALSNKHYERAIFLQTTYFDFIKQEYVGLREKVYIPDEVNLNLIYTEKVNPNVIVTASEIQFNDTIESNEALTP